MKAFLFCALLVPAIASGQCVECYYYPETPPSPVPSPAPAQLATPAPAPDHLAVQRAQQSTQSAQIQATLPTTITGVFRSGAGRVRINAPECK